MPMKKPKTEELIAGAILLQKAGELLEADETIVALSMKPLSLFKPDYTYNKVEIESVFVGLLRTAGYFLLDKEEASPAIQSDTPVADEMPDFPPLPFPRVWIEARDERGPAPLAEYASTGPGDDEDMNVLGIGIIEREPGRLWDVLTAFEFLAEDGTPSQLAVTGHAITPQGFADDMDRSDWSDLDEEGRIADPWAAIMGLAVTAAHLITAEKVPHHGEIVGRSQRKRWERDLKRERFYDGPRVYFVDLKAAGEVADKTPGGGGREYHVRWIVRGHYYKHPNGKFDVPEKGKCFFRKAYVKGPPGKPWKGRPVYVGGASGTPIE